MPAGLPVLLIHVPTTLSTVSQLKLIWTVPRIVCQKKTKKNSKIPLLCGFSFFVRLAARTEPEITGMKSELSFFLFCFSEASRFLETISVIFPPNVLLEPWQVCLCVQREKKKTERTGGEISGRDDESEERKSERERNKEGRETKRERRGSAQTDYLPQWDKQGGI